MEGSGLNLNSTNKMVKRFRRSETWSPILFILKGGFTND